MGRLYRGNWPHDGKGPTEAFRDDDPVIVEMETSRHWGPEHAIYFCGADLDDVERRLEKYVEAMAKELLNNVAIARVEGSSDLKGFPIGAVAKVKHFSCNLELEYTKPKTKTKPKKKKGG